MYKVYKGTKKKTVTLYAFDKRSTHDVTYYFLSRTPTVGTIARNYNGELTEHIVTLVLATLIKIDGNDEWFIFTNSKTHYNVEIDVDVYKAHKQTTTETIPLYCFRQMSGLHPLRYYFKEQEPTTSSIVYDSTGTQTTDTVTTGYDSYSGTVYVNSVMCIRYNTGDTSYEKETTIYKALRS